jgi:Mg-chelatase subunit ChlD
LPRAFDKAFQVPALMTNAVVLVLDRSASMQGERLEAAKESARAVGEILNPRDRICVIAFDTEASVVVRLQRASNRVRISTDIARIQTGGGTDIFKGLHAAFTQLKGAGNSNKHVIVLTDGEAPADGIADLVSDMRAAGITVSAVGIQGADKNLLTLIADHGDGRLYMVDDLGALPKIFKRETSR